MVPRRGERMITFRLFSSLEDGYDSVHALVLIIFGRKEDLGHGFWMFLSHVSKEIVL